MKLKLSLMLTAALLTVGCVPTTNSSTAAQRADRALRTAKVYESGTLPSLPAGQIVQEVPTLTAPTALTKATNQEAIPADGTEYQVDLVEMKQAFANKDPGRFVNLPTKFVHGYPVFAATCDFYPEHAECALADGETVDEAYLSMHTTVIRNTDVLALGLTCGVVCVDDDANVVGHVSKEMLGWIERNCTWENYGYPKCK